VPRAQSIFRKFFLPSAIGNFSLTEKIWKSFSVPRKSKMKKDFLGLKLPVAKPQGIKHNFKMKKVLKI
jgi:hypothetical protein